MTVEDLLNSVTFEQVAPFLTDMEDGFEPDLQSYKEHFDMLLSLTPQKGVCNQDVWAFRACRRRCRRSRFWWQRRIRRWCQM